MTSKESIPSFGYPVWIIYNLQKKKQVLQYGLRKECSFAIQMISNALYGIQKVRKEDTENNNNNKYNSTRAITKSTVKRMTK